MKSKKKQIAITLGIMCLLLVYAIFTQLKTTQNLASTAGSTYRENGLRDEVLKWKEQYDRIYADLENAEEQLEKERQVSISYDDTSVQKQEELKKINTYLGLTDVEGEGIIITLRDNTTSLISSANNLVHDGDLRAVVNELKNNGAEAISINDQRIVPTTAITCAGTVIQVNDEIVGSPFVIKAIGDKNMINNVMRSGGWLDLLTDYGISVEVKKSDNIKINKYNGVLTDKYIETIE
ncbi:MAG: DUF881 domain-containing protein [Clostridia bacterium]|nr:DUF881 domain-containing protein [Clostridia bacterium]